MPENLSDTSERPLGRTASFHEIKMNTGRIWLFGSLYINSVAAGIVICWFLYSPTPVVKSTEPASEAAKNERILSLKELINGGDQAVRRGNWSKAITSYRSARNINPNDPWLNYRSAIVDEATADLASANSQFLALSHDNEQFIADASHLGLARISMANGNWNDARNNLWRLYLQDSKERNAKHRAEIFHSIARASGEELIVKGQKPKVDRTTPLFITTTVDTPRLIRELQDKSRERIATTADGNKANKPLAEDKQENLDFAISSGTAQRGINQRVSVQAANVGLLELLASFANNYGFEVRYTAKAEQIVKRHSIRLDIVEIPVQTFLYGLLTPHDLCWGFENGQIQIFSRAELRPEELKSYSYQMSAYLLRSAVFDYPDHPLINQTKSLLALVDFQRERWNSAESMLQEMLRTRTLHRTMRNMALFNLGKTLYNLGRNDQATQTMYLVGDDLYGGDVAATAIMIAANEEIRLGNFEKAVRNNSQAISLANTGQIRARAILAMAVAYLLDQKPYLANQSIVDHRRWIKSPTDTDFATFLSALARFQVHQSRGTANTSELLRATLIFEQRKTDLGKRQRIHAAILVARAKILMGFERDAIEELLSVVENTQESPLRSIIAQRIGDAIAKLENNSKMAEFYERLMKAKLFQSADTVKDLRIASLQFESGKYDECIETCKRIISNTNETGQQRRALELQGMSHQRLGNFYAATLCFAGVAKKQVLQEMQNEPKQSSVSDGEKKQ